MAKKAEKYLVIVESPAKAKTIGKYLGPAYQVKACMGHLRDLPKSKLGVDVENDFEPNYRPIKGKEDIIRDLKQAAKDSDAVYQGSGHRLPRNRPGPRGRGHQLAPEAAAGPAGGQDLPGHLQRDHPQGGHREHPPAPGH